MLRLWGDRQERNEVNPRALKELTTYILFNIFPLFSYMPNFVGFTPHLYYRLGLNTGTSSAKLVASSLVYSLAYNIHIS